MKFNILLLAMSVGTIWWAIFKILTEDGDSIDYGIFFIIVGIVIGGTWVGYWLVCSKVLGYYF